MNLDFRALATVVILIVVFLAASTTVGVINFTRIHSDESKTCGVQATGLPASKDLRHVILDISQLLQYSNVKSEKKQGVPTSVVNLLSDLEQNAGAYAAIEATQLKSRSC